MKNPVFVEFGEWMPDDMSWNSQGSPNIKNVVPDNNQSYDQQKDLNEFTDALTAYCRGAIGTKGKDGTGYVYSGDGSKLYSLSNTTWTDVSQTAGYTLSDTDLWSFTNFRDVIIASNFANTIQAMTAGGSLFQDASATAPKAKHVMTINEFLVALNTNDTTDGHVMNRMRWCSIRSHTAWSVSPVTLSDYQDLDTDAGELMGGVEVGGVGVIFQERAIYLAQYIGPPVVFQIDKIEASNGLLARKGYTVWGEIVYYLGQDGFYAVIGGRSEPIGKGKVNKWFFSDLDVDKLDRISCSPNPETGIIYWIYPGSNNNGFCNRYIAFNPASNRWAYGDWSEELELAFITVSTGYTLEQLDNISASLDALPSSLDSNAWKGGQYSFGGFDKDHKMGYFDGSALTAQLDTKELDLASGQFVRMRGVKPVIDGGTKTAQIGSRKTLESSVAYSGSQAQQSVSGICPIRANAPYHRARVSVSGGFTKAKGVYMYPSKSGSK